MVYFGNQISILWIIYIISSIFRQDYLYMALLLSQCFYWYKIFLHPKLSHHTAAVDLPPMCFILLGIILPYAIPYQCCSKLIYWCNAFEVFWWFSRYVYFKREKERLKKLNDHSKELKVYSIVCDYCSLQNTEDSADSLIALYYRAREPYSETRNE